MARPAGGARLLLSRGALASNASMRQLLQNVSTGEITVEEVARPTQSNASLLVASRFSLISAGTERAALELGRASLVGKARARPDLVKRVVESARTEGVATTYAKVRGRLGDPNALGYSLAGVVLAACEDAPAAPGELVACAGAGLASHAEIVAVPRNLCARVPESVLAEDATYATMAAIALHGVRLARVGLGDVAAVVGLGLVGQLTVELLVAAGCVVLGCDPDERRVELAREAGAFATADPQDLQLEAGRLTNGRGADGVLVTAASKSSAPLDTATAAARERATVVIVGDVAIESPRAPLFAKELNLVVSRSYGPGRYDPIYESRGIDYPASYVRWTEGRNLEEVLRLMAGGALRPSRLTTHVFDLRDGAAAYAQLESEEPSLGILLRYSDDYQPNGRTVMLPRRRSILSRVPGGHKPRVGVVGAGAFARGVLLPQLARHAEIAAVATATGVSARASASRFGATVATTDAAEVVEHHDLDAILIATQHDTHASYTVQALAAGKHVFVEKPLALTESELQEVEAAVAASETILMVGFNRRFAPLAQHLRGALGGRGPLVINYRINAGRLPRSHWTHDPEVGGGRIVGEVCHFVDFACFLTGAAPTAVDAAAVGGGSEPREDSLAATLRFPDGSIAVIIYSALGDPGLPKERVEVLGEAGAGVLDDFSSLTLYRGGEEERFGGSRDKGHAAELKLFVDACRRGEQPWPVAEMAAVTRATFQIRDAVAGAHAG
jgi:predicted dehydrogenase/threonine dehydrogenase-like Zn-dependent dehydrogenase